MADYHHLADPSAPSRRPPGVPSGYDGCNNNTNNNSSSDEEDIYENDFACKQQNTQDNTYNNDGASSSGARCAHAHFDGDAVELSLPLDDRENDR